MPQATPLISTKPTPAATAQPLALCFDRGFAGSCLPWVGAMILGIASTAQAAPDTPPASSPARTQATSMVIDRVSFSGNTGFSAAQLGALPEVAALRGKSAADEAALRAATSAIASFYRSQGYMVSNAAVSKIARGEVQILVFEGTTDALKFDNQSGYDDEAIRRTAQAALCPGGEQGCAGGVLMSAPAERMTGLLSDIPGLAGVQLQLEPGSAVGRTQPTIKVERGPRVAGYVSADNFGGEFVGRKRLTGGVVANNLAAFGDQLLAEVSASNEQGNTTGQLAYSLPLGFDGWRAGVNYSRSEYLLGGDYQVLDFKGRSDTVGLYATYPFIRTQEHNLYFRGGADWGKSRSFAQGQEQPAARTSAINIGVNGRLIDHLWGRSFSTYGSTFFQTRITPKDSQYGGLVGNFERLTWNVSRDQELFLPGPASRLSFFMALRGQEAWKNLDGGQKIALGGPGGVRAYPGGEASGDRGAVANLELRYGVYLGPVLPGFLTAALFHDHGWKHNVKPANNDRNAKTLYGNGVALSLNWADRYNVSLTWAAKGSGSPTALTESNPKSNRVWLQATVNF
jgi:hemolysin activation/secretion protein